MTREEFIKALKAKSYSYEIVGDKLIVTHSGSVNLRSLKTLPSGVEFKNREDVYLTKLVTLPSGVEFNNGGYVNLSSLETLPSRQRFNNKGDIELAKLSTIHSGVEFKNEGDVYLEALTGDWFSEWEGNIEGIGNKTILNTMIKRELFSE